MKLKEFIEPFIARNTLLRLWHEEGTNRIMVDNNPI